MNPQSLNRYAYVMNNPTNLINPLGLGDCPPGVICVTSWAPYPKTWCSDLPGGCAAWYFGGIAHVLPIPQAPPEDGGNTGGGTRTTIGPAPDPNRTIIEAGQGQPPEIPSCFEVGVDSFFPGVVPFLKDFFTGKALEKGSVLLQEPVVRRSVKSVVKRDFHVTLRPSNFRDTSKFLDLAADVLKVAAAGKAAFDVTKANVTHQCQPLFSR